MWFRRLIKKKKAKRAPSAHYARHKEDARIFIHERLRAMNEKHGFAYRRVAIRDQKSRWGSCSAKGNLNFNYRLQFLPLHLADYVIAHELCHLIEFNHSKKFWDLVEKVDPQYRRHRDELHKVQIRRGMVSVLP